MFYVTSLDGSQVEPLINISSDFKMEQSTDGTFQVAFTCFPSAKNPGYELLRSKSIITVEGNDFKVKQYRDTAFSKSVTATSVFFEHSKTQREGVFEGNHTLTNHLAFALNGIDWAYTIEPAIASTTNYIENLGNTNVVGLLNTICKYHQCEYVILPNNRLHIAKQIGPDNDYQYRYKHNVSDVVLTESTNNLCTFVRGYGAEGVETSYTSPNVATFGRLEAEPVRDTRFTDVAALTNYIKNSITDVPELAIESRIPELTNREIGERVWLIYEPLNVEMQTRILKQTKILRDGKLITENVVFGNTLIKSAVDILVAQQEQINDNAENLNETKEELTEAKSEYRSEFIKTDDRITLEVEHINTSIAVIDVRADRIEMSVTDLATSTSSSINLLSDQLQLKVDVGGSITDINLTPGVATINADRINLNGAVMVNGSISGATYIDVTTDINLGRMIRFGDSTAIYSDGGMMGLNAWNQIDYQASAHYFYGTLMPMGLVDFSYATVIGLPTTA